MSVSEYALKQSVNAFSRIRYQVISYLRLDWRRTSPIKAKCNSASWTIIAIRIDNQFELVGTVSRLPFTCLLQRYYLPTEPHQCDTNHIWQRGCCFLLRAPIGRIIYLELSSLLRVQHHINTCLMTGGRLGLHLLDNLLRAPKGQGTWDLYHYVFI